MFYKVLNLWAYYKLFQLRHNKGAWYFPRRVAVILDLLYFFFLGSQTTPTGIESHIRFPIFFSRFPNNPMWDRGGRSKLATIFLSFASFCHYSYCSIELCGICAYQIATTTTIIFICLVYAHFLSSNFMVFWKFVPLYPFFLWCSFSKAPKYPFFGLVFRYWCNAWNQELNCTNNRREKDKVIENGLNALLSLNKAKPKF